MEPHRGGLAADYVDRAAADSVAQRTIVPEQIDGPVLISADELSGYLAGPGVLNPYGDFQRLRPTAIIDGGVLVYDGHFSVPLITAFTTRLAFGDRIDADPQAALAAARQVVALDPDNAGSWILLGRALKAAKQNQEARVAFEKAIAVAETIQPAYQANQIPRIREYLSGL